MAKRKAHTKKRRRTHRKGMSDGLSAKRKSRRRSSGGGKMLGMSKTGMVAAGKDIIGGAMGGYAGGKIYHMTATYTPIQKLLAFGVAGMAANMFGLPNVGAGIAGAYGFALAAGMPGMQEGEMEETDYTDKAALEEMADAMDEDGNPMFLADDGELHYLHELEPVDEDDMSASELLAAELLAAGDYPGYVQTY
jgi:hypothetical protein